MKQPQDIIYEVLMNAKFSLVKTYLYQDESITINTVDEFNRYLYDKLPGILREYSRMEEEFKRAEGLRLRYGGNIYPHANSGPFFKDDAEKQEAFNSWIRDGVVTGPSTPRTARATKEEESK